MFLGAVFAGTVFLGDKVNKSGDCKFRFLLLVPLPLLGTVHWIIGTVDCVQKMSGESIGFAHVLCSVSFIVLTIVTAIALRCLYCFEIVRNDAAKRDAEKHGALAPL